MDTQIKRISDAVESILNQQIKNEFDNSKLYRAMSNCLEFNGWTGASKLWKKYSNEEEEHAEKIISFMQGRDCQPRIPDVTIPSQKFKGLEEIVTLSDKREIETTKEWKDIYNLAWKENDLITLELARWFIAEQTEEENKMIYWRDRIVMFKATNKPLGDIDKEMGSKA